MIAINIGIVLLSAIDIRCNQYTQLGNSGYIYVR